MRWTVARSTDMTDSGGPETLVCAPVAPAWGHSNLARPGVGNPDLRHHHTVAAHFRDKFVRRLIDDRKGPVVAGDHLFELKETFAGERRGPRPHGEAIADWHDAHLRAIDLVDQPHVGEDRRVAHVVNGLAFTRGDDEPATGAEIDRASLVEHAGGVPGRHEGEVEVLVRLGAAGIAWIDLLHPKARHIYGELIYRYQRWRGLFADRHGIAGVILVPMRDVGHAGLPVRKGSTRMRDLPVSMRKQECRTR